MMISHADRLRCAALHAHADLRAAAMLLRRGRLVKAWRKLQCGYLRLEKALDTSGKIEQRPLSDQPLLAILELRRSAVKKVIQEAGSRWR